MGGWSLRSIEEEKIFGFGKLMMALRSSGNLLTAVKMELEGVPGSDGGGGGAAAFPTPSPPNPPSPLPRLSISKPSWVVRTESNVWREEIKKPNPPCVICGGTGRVDCYHCQGKGRTNCVDLAMLPKGEWPKWCKTCGGSGLGYCSRCLGTGEYRDVMGFHFMKMAETDSGGRNRKKSPKQP
ncbi:hypothetical protein BVC80_8957g33 [Macleaya cordata]|uniref:Heat shock protein DnaJ n=1 Tax=Macleaya cordata TaxID=56857 RepID=A0A200QWJ6_MACCD|nr:hypothetical protein BVC80_8957g33 [Macleaya cordata]